MNIPVRNTTEDNSIPRAALKVAVGGGLSLLAGLASQVVTAYLYGTGAEMDAFFTAMTIPLYLQIVLLGGLPFVVIPAFVRAQCAGKEEDAWSLTGTMLLITMVSLTIAAILGALFATELIVLCAPGFSTEKTILASNMLRLMMFTVPFSGLASFTSGVENVRGRFFWPAAATAIGSLGNVVALLILYPIFGAVALAVGNVISAILMAAITTIPILKHGWSNWMPIRDPRIIELLRLITPFIFFGLITNSRILFERYFASMLPDGQLSYIGYASKLANIFIALLASSIASAYFPAMARAYSEKGLRGLEEQTADGMRITLSLALPVVVIISVLGIPLVKLFFERGAFLPSSTLAVSILIPIVLLNEVLFRMITNLIGRAFFIMKDTITTNLVSSVTILIYLLAAPILTSRLEYIGLAAAQPIQVAISIAAMGFLLQKKAPSYPTRRLFGSFIQFFGASILAGLVAWLMMRLFQSTGPVLQLIMGGGPAALAYFLVIRVMDKDTAHTILEMAGVSKMWSVIQRRRVFAHR